MSVVYDAGALIAAERGDRTVWADYEALLERALAPLTTAPVVAQVSRSGRQAQLRRFLAGCEVVPFKTEDAHAVGALLARTGTSDVVDGHLALVAQAIGATVLTSDPDDLGRLSAELDTPVVVLPV